MKYEIRYSKDYKCYIIWAKDNWIFGWILGWTPYGSFRTKKHANKHFKRLTKKTYERKNQKLILA